MNQTKTPGAQVKQGMRAISCCQIPTNFFVMNSKALPKLAFASGKDSLSGKERCVRTRETHARSSSCPQTTSVCLYHHQVTKWGRILHPCGTS